MSVTSQIPYKSYTAAPGATLFSCGFKLLLATDLEVKVDSSVITSGFTVSGIGAATADVTFGVPMVGGEIVELQRKVPKTRATDYQQLGDYQASQVNFDFDRIVMMLQDSQFQNDLAVLLPVGDSAAPMTLPTVAERAGKFLAFDALGQAIAAAALAGVPVTDFIATLLNDTTSAEARATLDAAQYAGADQLATVGGTADALTLTFTPAWAALNGGIFQFVAASDNATTTPTGNPDGLGAKTFIKGNNLPLAAGDIKSGMTMLARYDSVLSKLVLLNPATGVITTTGVVTLAGSQTITGAKNFSSAPTFGTASMPIPAGSAPVYGQRAWCVFDGSISGTNAPLAGGNVTSVTRNSTGDYTVNLTIAAPTANFGFNVTAGRGSSGSTIFSVICPYLSDPTTTTLRFGTFDSGASLQNGKYISVSFTW
jgi:hypothetical protein